MHHELQQKSDNNLQCETTKVAGVCNGKVLEKSNKHDKNLKTGTLHGFLWKQRVIFQSPEAWRGIFTTEYSQWIIRT